MTNNTEIIKWLYTYDIQNYIITPNNIVNVYGDVKLYNCNISTIDIQFGVVTGDFIISMNYLTSLKGSPNIVLGTFNCAENKLNTLSYCPLHVQKDFICSRNNITTLLVSPLYVNGKYICFNNKINDLSNFPTVINGDFICDENLQNTKEYLQIKQLLATIKL